MNYKRRITALQHKIKENNIDAILITNNINRSYISGFNGSAGYLIISPTDALLITDFRYTQQASEQAKDFKVIQYDRSPIEYMSKILSDIKVKKLGFEDKDVNYSQYLQFQEKLGIKELVPLGNLISQIRIIKDADEISLIRKAANIADKAFSHIINDIKPGITENEIALGLEFFMKRNGAEALSFETIAASGSRSSLPHGHATTKKIQEGDFLTLDFGCVYNGYCSDMTRTIVIGKASERHKEIYDIVLEAQMKALEAIKPGKTGLEIDKVSRDIIESKGYGKHFGHGLGHGVGLEVHEEPRLSPSGKDVLVPGMVVTVEPGIYIEGFGGVRIEDLVVITDNGIENLTTSTKELLVI